MASTSELERLRTENAQLAELERLRRENEALKGGQMTTVPQSQPGGTLTTMARPAPTTQQCFRETDELFDDMLTMMLDDPFTGVSRLPVIDVADTQRKIDRVSRKIEDEVASDLGLGAKCEYPYSHSHTQTTVNGKTVENLWMVCRCTAPGGNSADATCLATINGDDVKIDTLNLSTLKRLV